MRVLWTAVPALAALVATGLAATGFAVSAAPTSLAPHRVVYDLSLAKATGTRGVENARGRIAFDFLGDNCEGYALTYRQVTVLESGEVGSKTSDMRTATFETGDGRSFRFRTDSEIEGAAAKKLDGDAERRREGGLAVRLKQPKPERFTFGDDPLFPSDHMKRLIAAARAGETTFSIKVFDGSDDGHKVYDTLAVIGRRIEPGPIESEPASKHEALAKTARWPVTLSYFAPGDGERTPIYVISFEMYENGVSRALTLDYGEFALKGAVQSIEMLPPSACQR